MGEYAMQDIASINRQFLIMAREAASSPSGEVITGLPRQILDKLAELSLEQIEEIAQRVGISLISFRLSESEFNRLISLKKSRQLAYSLAVVASKGR
jgi:flagellar transcriptional activator FlhD